MSDTQRLLVAELHGLAGSLPELEELLAELARGAATEPGCTAFRVLKAEPPGELVVLSEWSDENALRAHYATPHYRHYRERVGLLLARPSDVVVHHLAASFRALDPNAPDPNEFD